MKTVPTPQGKILVDEVETLTTLYQSHLRAFKQGLSFSHNPISDNAVGRFRTWYNQNPEIAAQQKGVYTEEDARDIFQMARNEPDMSYQDIILSLNQRTH